MALVHLAPQRRRLWRSLPRRRKTTTVTTTATLTSALNQAEYPRFIAGGTPLLADSSQDRSSTATAGLVSRQCQGDVAACCGGWILITWCLAHSVAAACGLASMRFVGIRCEGPAGVT